MTIQTEVIRFMEDQRRSQDAVFPTGVSKILTYMATAKAPGRCPPAGVMKLLRIEPGSRGKGVQLRLRGTLPGSVSEGDTITVSINRLPQYRGYQFKTVVMTRRTPQSELVEKVGIDEWVIQGVFVYTTHHSPNTLVYFEDIPMMELLTDTRGLDCAIVAMGPDVNVSPRFVYEHEIVGSRLALFHGDGLPHKTFLNIKSNSRETRLVLDMKGTGWMARGSLDTFTRTDKPATYDKIAAGFSAGGWGKPSVCYRFLSEEWMPVPPVRP